jgi:hypothetical protein
MKNKILFAEKRLLFVAREPEGREIREIKAEQSDQPRQLDANARRSVYGKVEATISRYEQSDNPVLKARAEKLSKMLAEAKAADPRFMSGEQRKRTGEIGAENTAQENASALYARLNRFARMETAVKPKSQRETSTDRRIAAQSAMLDKMGTTQIAGQEKGIAALKPMDMPKINRADQADLMAKLDEVAGKKPANPEVKKPEEPIRIASND